MSKSSELIYTSAARGLRPGSRGFCTVAMSESMPAGLVGPLENLSAYRHLDGERFSPVNYMHVQLKVAGRAINVLSRIAEAPPDYTGRTNKLAHHVIIAEIDRVAGGPAAVLRQPGFTIDTWNGEVRKIPEPKTIPQAGSPPRVAHTWAEQCGDAGWAGVVASIFEQQAPGGPLYLIYRPEQTAVLLELVDEAICLLPESKRWNATFSTHSCELPPGVDCRLRCLIAGSPEALSLPNSAMKLDLASGNLGTPPDGPLVDAARSGHVAPNEPVPSVAVSDASTFGNAKFHDPTAQTAASSRKTPKLPGPPPQTIPGTPAPPYQPKASPTKNHRWIPITIAALILLCLGAVAALSFLKTDSDTMLAELNAAAGIENARSVDVLQKDQPAPDAELEPEPDAESAPEANTSTEIKGGEQETLDEKTLKELEELAERILEGEIFLSDDHENSIERFSTRLNNELNRLAEQKKQLTELALQPTDDQLSKWVRTEDGLKQLSGFIGDRKNDVDILNQHVSLKDFQNQWAHLDSELKDWRSEMAHWRNAEQKQPQLILSVPNNLKVEQAITRIKRAEKGMKEPTTDPLDRYRRLSREKEQLADSIEKKLDAIQEEISAELKRRRDSHRLAFYIYTVPSRDEDRPQIKSQCEIALNPDNLQAIDRLTVDDSKPIPLSQSSDDVKLPGRFEGWLSVVRGDTGIVVVLNPKTVPPALRKRHPMLKQLDQFYKQLDATFESSKILRSTFKENQNEVNSGISNMDLIREKPEDLQKKIGSWKTAMQQMRGLLSKSPAKGLDDFYIEQTGQTAATLQSIRSSIAEIFDKFSASDVAIGTKIETHIKNLESLRDEYRQLKINIGPLDFGGKLVFGNTSGSQLGQSTFEPIETFELFFIPELVYGPPPKE